jgi:mono/diheme cytochrome c family protein
MSATRIARWLGIVCLILALGIGAFLIAARQPAIDPIASPPKTSFAPDVIKRGAELAALGNCDVCHTVPGGRPFAGGRVLPTPFGTIYATNISPDVETGIGNWSEDAFVRAMRYGIRRDGAYLYPAFPYDHFTRVSDEDDKAIYAYLMTRDRVRSPSPAVDLPFPLNIRTVVLGWDLLFLRAGPFRPDGNHDETWNRGAYLVDGLGHCGACHTPRNFLGAEKSNQDLSGGESEGWTAYALNAESPAPVRWSADALVHYLTFGFEANHGAARGPMAEVADDLHSVREQDIRAMAIYLADRAGQARAPAGRVERQQAAQSERGKAGVANSADSQAAVTRATDTEQGASIYVSACAGCHEGPRAMPFGGIDLALSSGIAGPSPTNLFNIVLYGLPAADAARAPIMPGFAAVMNDAQLVTLARYLRAHFSDNEPWNDIENRLRESRSAARAAITRPAPSERSTLPGAMPGGRNEAQR